VVDFRKTVKASLLLFDDRQRYTALKHVADMVLGIDFLLQRRLWLSYGSRRVFLPSR
jgi:hypothetical protein